MRLKLAYSPCPNDTFIFHAMVNSLIDCEGLDFDITLADVENLNQGALKGEFDVCKLSYNAFFHMAERYVMLRSGSALGHNNGPLFVTSDKNSLLKEDGTPDYEILAKSTVAIPGRLTTAALLLGVAFPQVKHTTPVIFSDIEKRVLSGEYAGGVLIHEGRFTFQKRGLKLIADLGTMWEEMSSQPIPLGGIAIRRDLGEDMAARVNRVLRRSVEYALQNPEMSQEYVCSYAQELDNDVIQKHINLFVNQYTIDVGIKGEEAVKYMYNKAVEQGLFAKCDLKLFIL
jgi:1,4-dihydroxy-6-naphthoate synthase